MSSNEAPEKKLLEKWQTWVALIVGILTLAGLLIDLPKKIIDLFDTSETSAQVVQPLSGVIWDDEENETLDTVIVFLPEFNLADTTGQNGKFEFIVKAAKQTSVNLIARKKGFETYDTDATLGNTSFNFTMQRKE